MEPPAPPAPPERFTLSPRTYRTVVLVALGLLCVIVVSGAAVRLSGSGLGCPRWPNCSEKDFVAVNDANQAIEQVNRLFTGAVSIGVIAAVLGALRRRPYRRDLVWLSLGLVVGVVAQAVLGGITVLVHLNPFAVAGHFLLSMVLVVDATVLLWRAGSSPGPHRLLVDRAALTLSRVAMTAGALILVVTGPLTTGTGPHAGSDAAHAGGKAVPRFALSIPDATRIHSLSAWVFLALVVVLLVRLGRAGAPAAVLRRGQVLMALVVAQGGIGYMQYELGIPAWLVALHIAGATAIAVAATWFHLGLHAGGVPAGEPAEPVGVGGTTA